MDLNVIDLFSGIGGFSLGLHNSDPRFKTIAFCEIDPFCQKVLQKNFPGVKIYDDIKDFKNTEPAFLVCGGFPCQGFSQAGLRRGTKDDRYLWGEMFAVIKQVKPRWIIAENVRGIVTTQDGLAFDTVHSDLESENYEVRAFNLPACGKGAWHRRERIFFIANLSDTNERDAQAGRKRQGGVRKESEGQWISSDAASLCETLSDSESSGHRGRSGEECGTEQRKLQQKKQEGCEMGSETERCGELSGEGEDVPNSKNRWGKQTKCQRGESSGRGSDDRSWIERKRKNISSNVSDSKSKGLSGSRRQESNQNENRIFKNQTEKQSQIRSKSKRCGGISNDVPDSEVEGLEGHDEHRSTISGKDEKSHTGNESGGTKTDVRNTQGAGFKSRTDGQRQEEPGGASPPGEQCQGDWSEIISQFRGVPDGVSTAVDRNRVNRLKALGNAVVPQVVEEIGRAIIKAEFNDG